MPPFHLPQNKCYGVIKYKKLNYSHRILNIPKIKVKFFFFFNFKFFFLIFFLNFFFNFFFEKKKLVREEKVVHAPTRTMSVNLFGLMGYIVHINSFRQTFMGKCNEFCNTAR